MKGLKRALALVLIATLMGQLLPAGAQAGAPSPDPTPLAPGTATDFVTRLYQQVLNRPPDPAGLQGHLTDIQTFGSVVPTVLAFFHSQEFLGRNTSNTQFLTICYHTFLNRDPDQAGFNAFLSDLQSGLRTRDNLLDIFIDSQEFAAQASFLPPQDPVTAFVINLFVRILGRGPDQAGLQSFVTQLRQSRTVLPTVQLFLASPEFLARNTSNTEFVTLLYRVFLGRVPDAAGLTTFVTQLTQGTATRAQLLTQFAASGEFQMIQQALFPPGPPSHSFTVTVAIAGTGSGTVTSSPAGINCPGTCTASFTTPVTLTATPNLGFFSGWSGGGCAGGELCTITMNTDTLLTARFEQFLNY